MSTIKKIVLSCCVSLSFSVLVYHNYKTYIKKENEFYKFMSDVKKLEEESMMTREIADMILEENS
jgi:hypothetical protein